MRDAKRNVGAITIIIVVVGLVGISSFSVAPSVTIVEAASAVQHTVQGCTTSAPPTINQIFNPSNSNLWILPSGWTVNSFHVGYFSYTDNSVKLNDLYFNGSYYQHASYQSWSASTNKTKTTTAIWKGNATVQLNNLSIVRNSTTLSVSVTGLTANLVGLSNYTGIWQTATINLSNSDFSLSWSCTQ